MWGLNIFPALFWNKLATPLKLNANVIVLVANVSYRDALDSTADSLMIHLESSCKTSPESCFVLLFGETIATAEPCFSTFQCCCKDIHGKGEHSGHRMGRPSPRRIGSPVSYEVENQSSMGFKCNYQRGIGIRMLLPRAHCDLDPVLPLIVSPFRSGSCSCGCKDIQHLTTRCPWKLLDRAKEQWKISPNIGNNYNIKNISMIIR